MSLDQLPVNVFDLIVVAVLALGLFSGRKHGMSEELLQMLKWLAVILVGAYLYQPGGEMVAKSSTFSLLAAFLIVYTGLALLVLTVFALVKHGLGGKLIGSDVFGRGEYYLGMGSGMIRCACMLIAALALLNARYFPPAEVRAMQRFQDDVYGSNFFPTLHTAQSVVFEQSLAGPWIRDNLGFLLIKPTQPVKSEFKQREYALPQ